MSVSQEALGALRRHLREVLGRAEGEEITDVIREAGGELATKADVAAVARDVDELRTEIATLRSDLTEAMSALRTEMSALRIELLERIAASEDNVANRVLASSRRDLIWVMLGQTGLIAALLNVLL